jgi:hypothetical protein
MTLFVHIGLNKTGSSSLQRFCEQNRELLRGHGLEYPEQGVHDSAHYGASKALIGQPASPIVPGAEGLDESVRAALEAGRRVLISSEYFFLASDTQVERLHAHFAGFGAPCRILVYLRRHDQWITSLFNQALKTAPRFAPWHSDIRDFALHLLGSAEFDVHYPVILDRWARHFGRESMIVRPFERAQFREGEYLWDALGCIDARLPERALEEGWQPLRVNESLPEPLLRAIAHVKSSDINQKTKDAVASLLVRSASEAEAAKTPRRTWDNRMFALPPYLKRSIANMFADDYRYIAENYLPESGGRLFREAVA